MGRRRGIKKDYRTSHVFLAAEPVEIGVVSVLYAHCVAWFGSLVISIVWPRLWAHVSSFSIREDVYSN